jgi:hypothetical protein
MADFDVEALGPGPDIEKIDTSGMDRGDKLGSSGDAVVQDEDDVVDKGDQVVEKADDKADDKADETDADDKGEKDEDDDEDEGDEKEEAPRDKDGKFAKKEKGDGSRIPKGRFNEAVAKEREAREKAETRAREAEERLRSLNEEDRTRVETGAQIEALEVKANELTAQYSQLLLDGNKEEAAKVMAEIRQTERSMARIESDRVATKIVSQRFEKEQVKLVVAKLESDHPQFNPDSEQYDDDLVQMVLMMQARLVSQDKLSPSMAMQRASEVVMGKFGLIEAKGAADKKDDKKEDEPAKKAEERKAAAAKKAVEASQKQPATLKDTGLDSDILGDKRTPDASKMTADEYAALPESTRARMRGDIL